MGQIGITEGGGGCQNFPQNLLRNLWTAPKISGLRSAYSNGHDEKIEYCNDRMNE